MIYANIFVIINTLDPYQGYGFCKGMEIPTLTLTLTYPTPDPWRVLKPLTIPSWRKRLKRGRGLDVGIDGSLMDDHPSVMILNGLQIEDDQYVCISIDV